MNKFYFIFISLFLISCSPRISTILSDKNEKALTFEVVVLPENTIIPTNYKKIGETKSGDTGFTTNCSYDVVINLLKNEAMKSGANALLITKHRYPNAFGSTCHRIDADLLVVEHLDSLKNSLNNKNPILKDTTALAENQDIQSEEVNSGATVSVSSDGFEKKKDPKFIAKVYFGPGFRTASAPDNISSEQKNYVKDLKSGWSHDISGYYMTQPNVGFGLKYNVFNSSASIANQSLPFIDGVWTGTMSDDIRIQFIGASYIISSEPTQKLGEFSMELSLGYMGYRNTTHFSGVELGVAKGGNLGLVGGFGYHFRITPYFLIGPEVNFAGGVLNKITIDYADGSSEVIEFGDEENESLWRIDLAIGAKFRF